MEPTRSAELLRQIPGCVSLSVWRCDDEGPVTVLALDLADHGPSAPVGPQGPSGARVLDAIQFLAGGPGTEALTGSVVDCSDREELARRWPLLASAAAGWGITGAFAVPAIPRTGTGAAPGRVGCVVNAYLARPPVTTTATLRLARLVGRAALSQHEAGRAGVGVDVPLPSTGR